MADLVKFLSGDIQKVDGTTDSQHVKEAGQVLFGIKYDAAESGDGAYTGTIYYDYVDPKTNQIHRVPMGSGGGKGGRGVTETVYIQDVFGQESSEAVAFGLTNEVTLKLPSLIYAEGIGITDKITYQNTSGSPNIFSFLAKEGLTFFSDDNLGGINFSPAYGLVIHAATSSNPATNIQYNWDNLSFDKSGNIVLRQIGGTTVREATLLDENGNTTFPGYVFSQQAFVGNLIGNADSATNALNDQNGDAILNKYLTNIELKESLHLNEIIICGLTGGGDLLDGTVDTKRLPVVIPVASESTSGLISADKTVMQTITGPKTIDADGSLEIIAEEGFNYSGLPVDSTDKDFVFWMSHIDTKGKPRYSDTLTFNPYTETLTTKNVKVTNNFYYNDDLLSDLYIHEILINDHQDEKLEYVGRGHLGTDVSTFEIPMATNELAGLISATEQSFAGEKTFENSVYIKDVKNNNSVEFGEISASTNNGWLIKKTANDTTFFVRNVLADQRLLRIAANEGNTDSSIGFTLIDANGFSGFNNIKIGDEGKPYTLAGSDDGTVLYVQGDSYISGSLTFPRGSNDICFINKEDDAYMYDATKHFYSKLHSLYIDDRLYAMGDIWTHDIIHRDGSNKRDGSWVDNSGKNVLTLGSSGKTSGETNDSTADGELILFGNSGNKHTSLSTITDTSTDKLGTHLVATNSILITSPTTPDNSWGTTSNYIGGTLPAPWRVGGKAGAEFVIGVKNNITTVKVTKYSDGNLSTISGGNQEVILLDANNNSIFRTILPKTTLTFDLGNDTYRWNDLYLHAINATGNISAEGRLTISQDATIGQGLTITAGGLTVSADGAVITGDSTLNGDLTMAEHTIYFTADKKSYINKTNYTGKAANSSKVQVNTTASATKYYVLGATGTGNQSVYRAYNASGTKNTTGVYFQGDTGVLYGAAWNDYAEFRVNKTPILNEPGRCVCENGDGTLSYSTKRLQAGANIISDTFGFAIGESEEAQMPIAVSGRVLAYPYEDRYSYKAGDPVCAGPNGTISKMTREEVMMYPDRIVGTVSEIPNYEEWGAKSVKVNNRIWIKVR